MQKNITKKLILIFSIAFFINGIFAFTVLASSTNGTIDSTYKYAWTENVGWINFAPESGNVHITDSSLSGSALSETIGWIILDNISNDGEGNLTGYAWGENTGWINFAPANGGVAIDSNGQFSGSALSETIGWIVFDGDYTAKTDWRPQTARPACNNGLDDDNDGLIDYPNDLGCESLTDTNEINPGGGLSSRMSAPPSPPTPSARDSQGEFKITINNDNEYTNKKDVRLKLSGGPDTAKMSISNFADFKNATQIPYQKELEWDLSQQDGQKTIYAKFYTEYGQSSEPVSDTIILDTTAPDPPTILYPQNDSTIRIDTPTIKGTAEKNSQIALELSTNNSALIQTIINCDKNGNWNYTISKFLADGNYQIKAIAQDQAQNFSEIVVSNFSILTFVFPPQEPTELLEEPKPIESFPPTEPTEPETPIIEPTKPTEPSIEPTQEPVEPPTQASISEPPIEEPAEPVEEPIIEELQTPTVSITGPWPKPLLNKISKKTKQMINSIINKVKDTGKSFTDSLAVIIDNIILKPAQKPVQKEQPKELVKIQDPIPTLEPQDLPEETMIIKTAYGDINLTPEEPHQQTSKIFGLSSQEIAIFVKPKKSAYGVVGQFLYNEQSAKIESQNQPPTFLKEGKGDFSFFNILKPKPALAENQTEPKQQFGGGWKISEFSFFDEDNNGIYKAQTKLPANSSDYTIRTLIAYKDGEVKTLDAPVNIDAKGYVYNQTNEGMIRILNAKITLFQYNQSQNKYELWNGSIYNIINPQNTNDDGTYSFFAPKGRYYLAVQADGYNFYKSKEFKIQTSEPVNFNIKLEKKFDWIKILTLTLIFLAIAGLISMLSVFFILQHQKKSIKK